MNISFKKSLLALALGASFGLAGAASADSTTSTDHSATVGAAITDAAITTKVKAKYVDDARLKGTDISVTTNNGVVTLTGSAPSSDAKTAAEQLAKAVDGVKSVDDQINSPSLADKTSAAASTAVASTKSAANDVATDTKSAAKKTSTATKDSWITTKVKSKLLADSVTKGVDISVTTTKGVVALSGSLDNDAAKAQAVKIAKGVKGVKSVDTSDLKVASS